MKYLYHLLPVTPLPFKPYFEHAASFSIEDTQAGRFLYFSINRYLVLIMLYTTTNKRPLFEELIFLKKHSGDRTL